MSQPNKSSTALLSSIISARENIKIKYNELKRGKYETDALINETLGPIIDPLNRIQRQQQQQQLQQQQQPITDVHYEPKTINTDSDSLSIYQRFESSGGLDKVYGVKKTKNGRFVLGNKNIIFNRDEILVGGGGDGVHNSDNNISYPLTSGLRMLLLSKDPKDYTSSDLNTYREILVQTSGHLSGVGKTRQNEGKRTVKISRGKKFDLISKLFPAAATAVGKGVNVRLQKYNHIYWNDVNELVDRLRLLYASLAAGNTGVRNEIIAICEELVECKLLTRIPNI